MQKCHRCKGNSHVTVTLKDLSGKQSDGCGIDHIISCPMCNGKGFIADEDRERYYRSLGVKYEKSVVC
jgi:hypothetical protein